MTMRAACVAVLLLAQAPAWAQPRPAVEASLDEVGYAAAMDGEGPSAIRGAHRALPIPSYVEVTALATGRTILVEIARRGAEVPGNVIDLSCGAVRQLGLTTLPGAVRVRRVSPPDQERSALSAGRAAAARLDAPEGLLSALRRKLPPSAPARGAVDCGLQPRLEQSDPERVAPPPRPAPEVRHPAPPVPAKPVLEKSVPEKPAPLPSSTAQPSKGPSYIIQVAALSSRVRAETLARSLGGQVSGAGSVFRVRTGPYASESAARAALSSIRAKGFADARVMPNEGR